MADRRTAAELRSFTMRGFLLGRTSRLAAYVRDAELTSARKQAITQGVAGRGRRHRDDRRLRRARRPAGGRSAAAGRGRDGDLSDPLGPVLAGESDVLGEPLLRGRPVLLRLPGFLRRRREPPRGRRAPPPVPDGFDEIVASQVTFTYPGADEPTLREVSLRIGRGQVVALVGENGSGKTTLAKVLAGLYQPDSGTVRWDATPLAEVDPDLLREQIAVIAQDHANWPLSVRHNITMGRDLDADRLGYAVAAADATEVIDGLAHGLNTLLDRTFQGRRRTVRRPVAASRGGPRLLPGGAAADHGRAHRVAGRPGRARPVLLGPHHAVGRSILMITHRLVSTRTADRIYVLDHGRVSEQGTHDELVARGGQYAELYSLQASQYAAPSPELPATKGSGPARPARRCRPDRVPRPHTAGAASGTGSRAGSPSPRRSGRERR